MEEVKKTREELIKENRYLRNRLQKPQDENLDETMYHNRQTIKAVLNILQDAAVIINSEGLIISYNEIAQQILCKNAPNPKGKNFFSYFPKHTHAFLKAKKQEVVTNGIAVNFEEVRDDKVLSISFYPIFDKKDVPQLVVFARDVTERKRIEESEFRKSVMLEQLLETSRHLTSSLDLMEALNRICTEAKDLLRSYGCAVYFLNESGTILEPKVAVDPIYREEVLSTPIMVDQSFTGRSVIAKKACIFNDTNPQSGGYQIPGTSVLENERIIVAPFIINDEVIGALCLNRIGTIFTQEDLAVAETFASFAAIAIKNAQHHEELRKEIISRTTAEAELENHREHLKLINRILRHDLMNYLAVIKSSMRIYLANHDEKLLQEAIKTIGKSADLINRMKELESFTSIHHNLKMFQARDVIEQVVNGFPDFCIEIKGNSTILADQSLPSVFENLIRNAILHSQTEKIKIEIISKSTVCQIHFIDYGIGIPDEIKDHIFEERFTYGEFANTGLGLYIVKKAIESYGGFLEVTDVKPQGTDFILTLKNVR